MNEFEAHEASYDHLHKKVFRSLLKTPRLSSPFIDLFFINFGLAV